MNIFIFFEERLSRGDQITMNIDFIFYFTHCSLLNIIRSTGNNDKLKDDIN